MTRRYFFRIVALLPALAILVPSIGLASEGSGSTVRVADRDRKHSTDVQPYATSEPGGEAVYAPDALNANVSSPEQPNSSPRFTLVATETEKGTIPNGDTLQGKVVGVADGDTLTVLVDKTQYKIRLQGIDAPEKDQPFGNQSKKAFSEKVFDKTVKVSSQGQDKYGRTLGIVYAEGCVNTAMVREGWAWHYRQYSDNKTLAKAEEEARAAKAGLWADPKSMPPWDWRHNKHVKAETKERTSDPFAGQRPLTTDRESKQGVSQETDQTAPGQKSEQEYWMTNSSGKRHNSGCRYYKNSNGHSCGPKEGVACKLCGG